MTAEQAARYQAELRDLPPPPKMIEKINLGDRFTFLDVVGAVASGAASLEDLDEEFGGEEGFAMS